EESEEWCKFDSGSCYQTFQLFDLRIRIFCQIEMEQFFDFQQSLSGQVPPLDLIDRFDDIVVKSFFENAGRVAGDDRELVNVSGNNCPRADNCAVSDRYFRENDRAVTDPDIVPNRDLPALLELFQATFEQGLINIGGEMRKRMIHRIYCDRWAEL